MTATTLAAIDPATADGAAKELLDQVQRTLGITPNMTKVMANSPALLRGYLALAGALNAGVLDAGTRERLAIATAEYNGCEYCLSAHTYFGANLARLGADELQSARSARSADPHAAALLRLSDELARGRGTVGEATLAEVRAAGVTDAEIGEVVGHLALNVLTNYFNIAAGVENEWPVVTPSSDL